MMRSKPWRASVDMFGHVVGSGLRLHHAAGDPQLALRALQPLEGELVEAVVVQLPRVGDEPDLERRRRRRRLGRRAARLVVAAAARRERRGTEDDGREARGVGNGFQSSKSLLLLVFDYESQTSRRVYQTTPRHPGGRPPGPRRIPPGASLAARTCPLPRRLEPPGRRARGRRDARGLDPAAPRREGRRPRGVAHRAARDVRRAGPCPLRLGARDRLPRPRPARPRPRRPGRHALAPGRRPARDGLRPRRDRARRARAAAREAVVLERRASRSRRRPSRSPSSARSTPPRSGTRSRRRT